MATIDKIKKNRIKKSEIIKKAGINPYPAKTKRTHKTSEAVLNFKKLEKQKKKIVLAGRIKLIRTHGKSCFLHFEDGTGKIQAYLKQDVLGEKKYQFFLDNFDIGDFIEIKGTLFKTKTGEKTIKTTDFKILAKSLLPLPEKWHGLKDVEERYRRRYLDLIMNPEVREMFVKKTKFWTSIRKYLVKNEFLEVETPVLEAIPGGADARPFTTHHWALDTDFYLRISLELHLKRLIVGGFEKIFEIGRVFRNEGMDAEHLQDYTQMEFYWSYADYHDLMDFLEDFYKYLVKETAGELVTVRKGEKINWGKKWKRIDFSTIFKEKTGLDPLKTRKGELFKRAKELGLTPRKFLGKGRLLDLIYKKTVRPTITGPAFLINIPIELSPLAKRDSQNPAVTQRLLILVGGTELGNGFSELNNPIDQKKRFEEQQKLREAGDEEAQMIDYDFIEALEYGMPPTAGFGMSERLFAFLMDKPMRECVFFPLMRKED